MDILGIGISELIFIVLIAFVVLGPRDMRKAGKTIGKWMNKVVRSKEWQEVKNASRQIKTLPNQLMREANLDEVADEINQFRRGKINVTMPKDNADRGESAAPKSAYGTWVEGEQTIAPPAPPPPPEPAIVKKIETPPTKVDAATPAPSVEKDNA